MLLSQQCSAMPLWSNEDWCARIGSCWCALGQSFNTRFTRCRGKSQRDLSTHQAATMVIMMILFIAANLGLYVTRERHKNLICKFGTVISLQVQPALVATTYYSRVQYHAYSRILLTYIEIIKYPIKLSTYYRNYTGGSYH